MGAATSVAGRSAKKSKCSDYWTSDSLIRDSARRPSLQLCAQIELTRLTAGKSDHRKSARGGLEQATGSVQREIQAVATLLRNHREKF